jgi:hypothetical protein
MIGCEEADMPAWTEKELTMIGGAEELRIASRRADGSIHLIARAWAVKATL